MVSRLLHTFSETHWSAIPSRASVGAMAALVAFIAYAMTAWGWVPLLSGATLLIHEAGHPIFGILSERLMVYGGSMLQLIFPLAFAWHFHRQSHALGYCFAWAWEASSLRNVGIYAADARAQGLPLVGAGDRLHDWAEILGRWGWLAADHWIGYLFGCLAWVILAGVSWLLLRLWAQSPSKRF